MVKTFFILVFILTAYFGFAQAPEFATKIDSLLSQKSNMPFNGIFLIAKKGKVELIEIHGFSDMNKKTGLGIYDQFVIGSISKQITAVLVLQEYEKGHLKLTDPISKYLPDLTQAWADSVTIHHLLSHTHGIMDENKPLLFKPGSQLAYGNTGYMLLSVIIEKASGMSYAQYLDAAIFKPLGMKHTRVYNTRRAKGEKIENYAYGYVYSAEKKKYVLPDSTNENNFVIYMDPITGDGTVNSCIEDLTKWENGLLTNSIIEKKYLDIAYTDHKLKNGQKTGYGYGLFLDNDPGTEHIVYHTGGWPGYVIMIMRLIDQHKAIVVLCNNENGNFTKLSDDIASLLLSY